MLESIVFAGAGNMIDVLGFAGTQDATFSALDELVINTDGGVLVLRPGDSLVRGDDAVLSVAPA